MQRWLILACSLGLVANDLSAAFKTQARLVLAADSTPAGQTVMAGIQLTMEPGWHIYWRHSGESGSPTTVTWSLPSGVTAGELQWPVPEKMTESDLTTYVYQKEVTLLAPLTLAKDLPRGSLVLKAKVTWLECEQQCVPGETEVQASLNIGDANTNSAQAGLLNQWQHRLPKQDPNIKVQARWDQPPGGTARALVLEWTSANAPAFADFFPYPSRTYELQPAVALLPPEAGKARMRLVVKKSGDAWPSSITGLLVAGTGTSKLTEASSSSTQTIPAATEDARSLAYEIKLEIPEAAYSMAPAADANSPSLLLMLVYAFLGGLVLNVMPCVLPVIALKILGFVNQSKEAPRQVLKLGLIYAAGVLTSFLVLAGLVIGLNSTGHKAGWGMQLGNPQFLVILTVLVTLVALNLFGLFEINPGSKVLGVAGDLSAREGSSGAFFNGILATVLATPCTAPFLGTALGFAFLVKSPLVLTLIFLTVGLGLSAPYVILSWQPGWLKYLPKPGGWMEKFKVAMGFPMLGTAVWLFNLTPRHYGRKTVLWLGLFLVIVALTAWIYGEFIQRGRRGKALAAVIILLLLAADCGYVLEGQLHWRSPVAEARDPGSLKESADGIDWQRWSAAAVAKARAEGHPVFVDFTADWCTTCQVNKKISIEIPSVRTKLKEINAVSLLGDYTTLPPEITTELNRYSRAGVPLVLVYPKQADRPAIVLPEVLTPQRVLNALEQAAQ